MTLRQRILGLLGVTFGDTIPDPISRAIAEETHGSALLPRVSRDEALSIPGVMRARNTICSISTLPLVTYRRDWNLEDNRLLRQIDPSRANVATLADTVEDLLFNKYAYWRILEFGSDDYPVSAEYVAFNRVSEAEEKGELVIRIDGKKVDWEKIIKFESPNPAFLTHGGRVIKRALDLDETSAKYARNPKPLSYFKSTDLNVDPDDDDGIRAFLRKWRRWLSQYVTGYVPAGLEYVNVDQPTPAELQLLEAQKQVALSIANMTGLDPEDLGVSTTSRTYQNAVDRRQDRINEVLSAYMQAITQRLSMGDVTKNGHTVQFDVDDYLRADPKTRADVQLAYKAAGVITNEEIRTEERLPPLAQPQPAEEATSGAA